MKIQPTISSRIALFESHINSGYYHPIYSKVDALNYYEKAWEYIQGLPKKEEQYYNYGINKEIDPDVDVLELVITDHDGTLMFYSLPFDKNYRKFKMNIGPDDVLRILP